MDSFGGFVRNGDVLYQTVVCIRRINLPNAQYLLLRPNDAFTS